MPENATPVMWFAFGLGGLSALLVPGWIVAVVGVVLAVVCKIAVSRLA